MESYCQCRGAVVAGGGVDYLGFHKLSRKVWASWVLSLNKRVGVSACQLRMPDTHVFVPTLHKSFLDDLLENKKSEVPPCHKLHI